MLGSSSGCVRGGRGATAQAPAATPAASRAEAATPGRGTARDTLAGAEEALQLDDPARAVALLGRWLGTASGTVTAERRRAFLLLAEAHERLRDCAGAIRALDAALQGSDGLEPATRASALMRRGACEAELAQWERSAASFRAARSGAELDPSAAVECHAREGFALFQLDRFDEAGATLQEGEQVYVAAEAEARERFATYYFVGMSRFYRAAIAHRRFREVRIRIPKAEMTADYEAKLQLLVAAQDAYRETIRARHVFWVSAAGYQMGRLFGEFYDAVMYAPVPTWLDARGRRIYYEELRKQLRPVIEKAIWVFEKNLETARRLGYDNEFVRLSQEKLAHLRGIVLAPEAGELGHPHPRLVPESLEEVGPLAQDDEGRPLAAVDRKLFVPRPTPLR
jgi:tetratricopeptide (TPR) repeat protein